MKAVFHKFLAYKLHHVTFWSLYYLFWFFVYQDLYRDKGQLMQVTALYVLAHSSIYYFSQYYLIPKVLHRKNLFLFLSGFLLTALLLGLVMYGSFGLIFSPEELQVFGNHPIRAILYLLFSNLFVGGTLLGTKSLVESFRNRRLNERLKTQRLENELHYLKAQVNPHFLFNTINSVYVLIKMDPEKASRTLIKLSELLRSQLYEFGDEEIQIEKEMEYLDNYIALEKIRKGDRVLVEVERDGELNGFKLPPLMLIPFLENSFKYVSNSRSRENLIKIGFNYEKGSFSASFFNTTEGLPAGNEVGGIGLKNVKRRLELLYPKRHVLEIAKGEESFTVNLKIQIHEN